MTDKVQPKEDLMMVIYLWQLFIMIVNISLLPCAHSPVCFYPSVISCHVLRL